MDLLLVAVSAGLGGLFGSLGGWLVASYNRRTQLAVENHKLISEKYEELIRRLHELQQTNDLLISHFGGAPVDQYALDEAFTRVRQFGSSIGHLFLWINKRTMRSLEAVMDNLDNLIGFISSEPITFSPPEVEEPVLEALHSHLTQLESLLYSVWEDIRKDLGVNRAFRILGQ